MSQIQSPDFEQAVALARQGDPGAIAQLMNHYLLSTGITARVDRQGDTLSIFLESAAAPDQQRMMDLVQGGIANLKPEGISLVKVYGCELHQNSPLWRQEISLAPAATAQLADYTLSEWFTQGSRENGAQPLSVRTSSGLLAPAENTLSNALSRPTVDNPNEFKLLPFYVSRQDTASLPLDDIEEVIKLSIREILPVPNLPDRVLGIYNWRSEMLWLVDLGQQLGFPSPIITPHVLETIWAIVIRVDGKLLGLGIPQLIEVETHSLKDLQQPTENLFATPLRSFLKGYLIRSRRLVLEAKALIQDPLLQVHCQ